MDDKFSNRLPGDTPNEARKRCTPGNELAGKGYLKDVSTEDIEEGFSTFDGPRDMDQVRMKKQWLRGEW